jgi:hypothetical protein
LDPEARLVAFKSANPKDAQGRLIPVPILREVPPSLEIAP